jgi:hypothetical protein
MYEYVPTEDTYDISMRGMHNLPMVHMYELGQSCAQASTTIASGVYCYRAYQKFHVDTRAGSRHVESTASRCEGFAYWIRYVTHDNESMGVMMLHQWSEVMKSVPLAQSYLLVLVAQVQVQQDGGFV